VERDQMHEVKMVSMRFVKQETMQAVMLCQIHMTDAVRDACHVNNVVISSAGHAGWSLEPHGYTRMSQLIM
jgi:hypothetical protein